MKNQLKLYLFVGTGGMIGAVSRYSISLLISSEHLFPWETLIVNFLGAFALTFLLVTISIQTKLSPELFTSLTVGVVGSFTTFSTVAYEAVELWQTSSTIALGYTALSFFGSLGCCLIALLIANKRHGKI